MENLTFIAQMNDMLKNSLFAIFIATVCIPVSAQQVFPETKVTSATVFLSGAQVHREGSMQLSKGNNEIVLQGITDRIDPNSIQVEGTRDYTIISVNHRTNYLQDIKETDEIKIARDSIELLNRQIAMNDNAQQFVNDERQMILSNKQVLGSTTGFDIEELLDLADFYRNRLKKIEMKLIDLKHERKSLDKRKKKYEQQIREWSSRLSKPTSEITIKVSTDRAKETDIGINYFVYDARWVPSYDVRTEDVKSPVQLIYKGDVRQNTGEDWKDISITLSTGNPTVSGVQPDLASWVLRYRKVYERETGRRNSYSNRAFAMAPDEDGAGAPAPETAEEAAFNPAPEISEVTTIQSSGVNNEFHIDLPYTVRSNNDFVAVEIQKINLPARYNHISLPRQDVGAFLLAKVTGWEAYSLLPGSASLYFQGNYVGDSYINTKTTSDTLQISLGRDPGVNVTRKKVTEENSTQTIGSNKKKEVSFEITIRNTQSYTITLDLVDQVPVSGDKDIEIEVFEYEGANYTESNGKLQWSLILGPGETRTVMYGFSVKYPKNLIIPNL